MHKVEMHLGVGQLPHEGWLMFHPDHRIPVTLKGDRMLEQVDGQSAWWSSCSLTVLEQLTDPSHPRLHSSCRTNPVTLLEVPESALHRQFPFFFHDLKKFQNIWKTEIFHACSQRINYTFTYVVLVIRNNSLDEGKGKLANLHGFLFWTNM